MTANTKPITKMLTGMRKMETEIKRLAQFLFDNAATIAKELRKSPRFRAVSVEIDMFKHEKPELRLSLSFYDEKTTHYYLYDDAICVEEFKRICKQANIDSGIISLPTPVKVRKKL